jgi:hypothetical protein
LADSPYFDPAYFDSAYFDAEAAQDALVVMGGRFRPTEVVPEPPINEDAEFVLLM